VGLPTPHTPWRSGARAGSLLLRPCVTARGLSPSLLGVVVSELLEGDAAELPPGVHKFKQVGHGQECVLGQVAVDVSLAACGGFFITACSKND